MTEISCSRWAIAGVYRRILQACLAHKMLESGVPIHIVSRILGHSKMKITVDIYGHVTHEGAANTMQLLNKNVTPNKRSPKRGVSLGAGASTSLWAILGSNQ